MITMAFLGILMAIAIPNFLNFQKRAKEAEARLNLGSIRDCMVAYYAENNNFNIGDIGTIVYNVNDNQGTPFGASSTAVGDNMAWDRNTGFSVLGFQADSAVYFNYSLDTNNLNGGAASFTAMASADLDRNTLVSHFYITNTSVAIGHDGDAF